MQPGPSRAAPHIPALLEAACRAASSHLWLRPRAPLRRIPLWRIAPLERWRVGYGVPGGREICPLNLRLAGLAEAAEILSFLLGGKREGARELEARFLLIDNFYLKIIFKRKSKGKKWILSFAGLLKRNFHSTYFNRECRY